MSVGVVIGECLAYFICTVAVCWLARIYQWMDYALVVVGWASWGYFVNYLCNTTVEDGNCRFALLWFSGFKMIGLSLGILSMTLFRYQYIEWTKTGKCQSACCPWTRALPLVKHWSLAFNIMEAAISDMAEIGTTPGKPAAAYGLNVLSAVLIVISQTFEYFYLGRKPRRMIITEGWGKLGWDQAPQRKGTKLPALPEEEEKRLGVTKNSDGEYVDAAGKPSALSGPSVQYWPLSTWWWIAYTAWNMVFFQGYVTGWQVVGSQVVLNIPTMLVPALFEYVNPGTWAMVRAQSLIGIFVLAAVIFVKGPVKGRDSIIAYEYYSEDRHLAMSVLSLLICIGLLVRDFMEYRGLNEEQDMKTNSTELAGAAAGTTDNEA